MSKPDGSRRAFLRGAYLTREGRAKETARQNPLGPVPPWHQGLSLEKHCPTCARPCVQACEPAIIRFHPDEHDHAGLPYLDFSVSGCTFCKACVDACPIEIDATSATSPEIGKAHLNRSTCIAWNDIICQSCVGRCDQKAISTVYQRRAVIDPVRCNGCGMCVAACPVGALSVPGTG